MSTLELKSLLQKNNKILNLNIIIGSAGTKYEY